MTLIHDDLFHGDGSRPDSGNAHSAVNSNDPHVVHQKAQWVCVHAQHGHYYGLGCYYVGILGGVTTMELTVRKGYILGQWGHEDFS